MATQQRFFRLDGAPEAADLPTGLDLQTFSPSLMRLRAYSGEAAPPLALYLFWSLLSAGTYVVYYVRDQGRVVHFSHVLGRSFKFPFMGKHNLHVGPCWTAEAYRGRGIYPAALWRIAQDHIGHTLWMLTDAANISSQRGIEKAGFRFIGTGWKRRGIYRLTQPVDHDR